MNRTFLARAMGLALLMATIGSLLAFHQEPLPTHGLRPDPYFTPIEGKDTLKMPRVIMRNMLEDRGGDIWFATFGGPIRYDGQVFTNFAEEVGLPQRRIFSLLEDRAGVLWFGSITGGASRYDGKSVRNFTKSNGLPSNDVNWIFEDRDGNIWFGTEKGVSRFAEEELTNFGTKDGFLHDSVYAITQDAGGKIWFGTQGGICFYDGEAFTDFGAQIGRTFSNIRTTVVDRGGNVWFGGEQGAFRYDGKVVTAFTSKNGLTADFVGSMIVDRNGGLWMGHPGGFPAGQGGEQPILTASHSSHSRKPKASRSPMSIACWRTALEESGLAALAPVHAATTAKFLWISLQFLLRGSESREGTGPEKARVRAGSLGRSAGGSGDPAGI